MIKAWCNKHQCDFWMRNWFDRSCPWCDEDKPKPNLMKWITWGIVVAAIASIVWWV